MRSAMLPSLSVGLLLASRLSGSTGGAGVATGSVESAGGRAFYVGCNGAHDSDASSGLVPSAAWRTPQRVNEEVLYAGDRVMFARGCAWPAVSLIGQSGNATHGPVTYAAFGDSSLPKPQLLGSLDGGQAADWQKLPAGGSGGVPAHTWAINVTELYTRVGAPATRAWGPGLPDITDVGNIVLGGRAAAVKLWWLGALREQDDFYFDWAIGGEVAPYDLLYFCSPKGNPATVHAGSIQLALLTITHAIVRNQGASHLVFENLSLKYGGGDGMAAIATSELAVRHCDISWIGGGCLGNGTWPPPISPLECVRFGNGIEFPDFERASARARTENIEIADCTLSEVYDAALSPQGNGWYIQRNITFHHNLIWHAEYCLEIWSQGLKNESTMTGVSFLHNVCVNSGGGWGHAVRPNPSGRHICSFQNPGNVSDIVIRNNIFWQSVPYQVGIAPYFK